jgi:thiamine-phosphate pyrophosphorylase
MPNRIPERPVLHLVVGLGLTPNPSLPTDRQPSNSLSKGEPSFLQGEPSSEMERGKRFPLPMGEGQGEGGLAIHSVLPRATPLAVIRAAADNGVDWVQVRDHRASARDVFDLAQEVVRICRPRGVRVAVNDRLDVALAAKADAVQLGGRSLPVAVAREIAGGLQIGVSVHDVDAAIQAEAAGADWITFGHVFPTPSHPDEPARGVAGLARVVQAVQIPVIAIGGIDPSNVEAVLGVGAAGIAVISAITNATDPGQATATLRRALDRRRSC